MGYCASAFLIRLGAFAAVQERPLPICKGFGQFLARRNSSLAPQGIRNQSLPNPRIRLSWATSISTFSLCRIEILYCVVLAMSRAT